MANITYTVLQLDTSTFEPIQSFKSDETGIVESFAINSLFDQQKHTVELHFYDLDGNLVQSVSNFEGVRQLGNAAGAGKQGASNIILDVAETAVRYGYTSGDIRLLYRFTNNLFSDTTVPVDFFVESISADRKEIRALTNDLTDQQLTSLVSTIQQQRNTSTFFSEFFLNFGNNGNVVGVNITSEVISKGTCLTIKLYEPLPSTVSKNSVFTVEDEVGDEVLFEVVADIQEDVIKVPFIKGPNFDVEITEESNNPSEFFNYNELFSYPVTNSFFELKSLFDERSAQIAIDHTDYSSFIHFSSAEERLRNFKYKLELLQSYEASKNLVVGTGTSQTGSIEYYDNLINGLIQNFDHYDRFLFYESSSYSWPKQNTVRPYVNQDSNSNESNTWFTNQLITASLYDVTNFDILTNTIPAFIREDVNNEPYLMFIHMIGQHFDNLWIYFKAVSDKYDADNRLNFGISKDLVRSAIESLGYKLFDSNQNFSNLFNMFTGEGYISGSEVINQTITAVSGSGSDFLQPVPIDNYLKEIYKRIYHNLPLLTKSKGTERGLRALINSFGIPSNVLKVKMYGGVNQNINTYPGLGYVTSSIDKVRVDNTGSFITGSTLSPFSSIVTPVGKYSDDLNVVDIGFDISEIFNSQFINSLPSKFSIDNLIGDPRDSYNSSYSGILDTGTYISGSNFRDVGSIVRLAKFFDNSIFRIIKQFIPAKVVANTGIIVKPNILNRSKAKQVEVSFTNNVYTSSLQVGSISGSHGDSYLSETSTPYTTAYTDIIKTPIGRTTRSVIDESPKYNGELSGSNLVVSTAELNDENTFKKVSQPLTRFNITVFNLSLPIPPSCTLALVARYDGEYFTFYAEDGGGTVQVIYPTVGASSTTLITHVNNYNVFEFFSVEASPVYPNVFFGWYTQPNGGGTLVESGTTLTVTREVENLYGTDFYANFEGENYY